VTSPREHSKKAQLGSWKAAHSEAVEVQFDWQPDHLPHDRHLKSEAGPVSEDPTPKGDGDDSPNKIKKGERLTRYVIYWITLGFFLDVAVYFARYDRTNQNHDEFHAALMILCFLAGLSMDIWFVVRQYGMLFNSIMVYDIYFGLICATNAFAIPQLSSLR
jgi:hypothetical protein